MFSTSSKVVLRNEPQIDSIGNLDNIFICVVGVFLGDMNRFCQDLLIFRFECTSQVVFFSGFG